MTAPLAMRTASRSDLPTIVALLYDDDNGRRRENPSEPLEAGYDLAFDAITADPNQELIVVEQDGTIVGTLQLSFLPGIAFRGAWRGQIESVRIARALRGQGLGGQLIDWAVERCRARGCRMVQLTSHADRHAAHRFYERLGWAKSHVGFKLMLGGA